MCLCVQGACRSSEAEVQNIVSAAPVSPRRVAPYLYFCERFDEKTVKQWPVFLGINTAPADTQYAIRMGNKHSKTRKASEQLPVEAVDSSIEIQVVEPPLSVWVQAQDSIEMLLHGIAQGLRLEKDCSNLLRVSFSGYPLEPCDIVD